MDRECKNIAYQLSGFCKSGNLAPDGFASCNIPLRLVFIGVIVRFLSWQYILVS